MSNGSTDPELGQRVKDHLKKLGLESPIDFATQAMIHGAGKAHIEEAMSTILQTIGMDLSDDSIEKTPARVAKMYMKEIFYGVDYANFPKMTTFQNKFKCNEMICMKNILVRSVCEHHLVPFIGRAHVAYIPGEGGVTGLSKLNRIVDFFCRRPQVQERLNEQVAAALTLVLGTEDVAVVIDAEHYCIKLRGVEDPHSSTVTSKLLGKFRAVPELRAEFLALAVSK
jgi:GTP cyclohydrolase I